MLDQSERNDGQAIFPARETINGLDFWTGG